MRILFQLALGALALDLSLAFSNLQPLSSSTLLQRNAPPKLPLHYSQLSHSMVHKVAGIDFEMGDLAQNPHPFGQIPCLVDDTHGENVVVFESGAILLYLNSLLARDKDNPKRQHQYQAEIYSWVSWANASLDPICFLETPQGKVYDTGLKDTNNKKIRRLNQVLQERTYLVEDGNALTVADVAVASYLLYVVQFFPDIDLSAWPEIVRYMKDCASRENYAKAFGNCTGVLLEKLDAMGKGPKKKKVLGMF